MNYCVQCQLEQDDCNFDYSTNKKRKQLLKVVCRKCCHEMSIVAKKNSRHKIERSMTFIDRLKTLGYQSYEDYLNSPHWAQFKRAYRTSGLPVICAVCGGTQIELHHRTYERLGNEAVSDMIPLCRTHHEGVHKYLGERKKGVRFSREAVGHLKGVRKTPKPSNTSTDCIRAYRPKSIQLTKFQKNSRQFEALLARGITHSQVPGGYVPDPGQPGVLKWYLWLLKAVDRGEPTGQYLEYPSKAARRNHHKQFRTKHRR